MAHHSKLSSEERSVLAALLREGLSLRTIANRLDRSVSTVSSEIARYGKRETYDPHIAQFQTRLRRWEANRRNPLKSEKLRDYTRKKLQEGWSPEIIAGRLKRSEGKTVVCHETIYRWTYQEGLTALLPKGTPRRQRRRFRLRKSLGTQGLGNVTGIEKRPLGANNRTHFGHWEGDTMVGGRESGPAVCVQAERKSRYLLLKKLRRKTANAMQRAVTKQLTSFPLSLRRSITLDRGTENAKHRMFGLPVYFCDPYSSWQKGSVEQIIGLMRRYIPKGTDLQTVTSKQLQIVQDRLNNRPRKILGFQTPHEVFSTHCKTVGVRI